MKNIFPLAKFEGFIVISRILLIEQNNFLSSFYHKMPKKKFNSKNTTENPVSSPFIVDPAMLQLNIIIHNNNHSFIHNSS